MVVIANPSPESADKDPIGSAVMLFAPAIIQFALGAIKIKKSSKQIELLTICEKCGEKTSNSYDCEHTNFQEWCSECYTELHYYITEKDSNE